MENPHPLRIYTSSLTSPRLRIALPGYLPFDTMVDLRPQQKLKIQTDLVKGSITEAGSQVIKQ